MGLETDRQLYELECHIKKLYSRVESLEKKLETKLKQVVLPPKEKKLAPLNRRLKKLLDSNGGDLVKARTVAYEANDEELYEAVQDLMSKVQ